MEFMFMNMT